MFVCIVLQILTHSPCVFDCATFLGQSKRQFLPHKRRVDVFMKMARKWHESQKIARKWHETAIGHFIVPKQLVMMSDR